MPCHIHILLLIIVYFNLKNLVLWTGSETDGSALKDRPIRSCPFSQDHIYFVRWRQPNIWGSMSMEKIHRGPWAQTLNIGLRQCSVEFFLRYGLEKAVMTSLGAGFINHTPPG